MKRTILCTALLSLVCSAVYADDVTKPAKTTPDTSAVIQTPKEPVKESSVPAAVTAPVIDCQYRLPANTNVNEATLKTWVEKATVQSFDFNPESVDEQLIKLKPCFTDQGWQSYNDALQKSGNINTIKAHKLHVSSQLNGEININTSKDNQWKITLPLQVVYQNDKEKLTQLLTIDLLVGRKISGDLGILQIIATPKPVGGTTTPAEETTKSPGSSSAATPSTEPLPAPASE